MHDSFYAEEDHFTLPKEYFKEAINIIMNDLDYALNVYYSETKQEKSELMNSIIIDTYKRFISPFDNSLEKWKDLYNYTVNNKVSDISEVQYSKMFASL